MLVNSDQPQMEGPCDIRHLSLRSHASASLVESYFVSGPQCEIKDFRIWLDNTEKEVIMNRNKPGRGFADSIYQLSIARL